MLYREQKRSEKVMIKAKKGILELAEELYHTAYPFAEEVNINDLFEELVVRSAYTHGLYQDPSVKIVEEKTPELPLIEVEETSEEFDSVNLLKG